MSDFDDAAQDPGQESNAISIRELYAHIQAFEQRVATFQLLVAQRRGNLQFGGVLDTAQYDEQSLRLLAQIESDLHFFIKPYPSSPTQAGGSQHDPPDKGKDEKDDLRTSGQGTSQPSNDPVAASSYLCPNCKRKMTVKEA